MQTIKLYNDDSYLKEMTTTVLKCEQDEHGPYVVLKETVFYPTGGGQAHDTGLLDGKKITNVALVQDEIRHYLTESIEVGKTVQGSIDWIRRFDLMQQHLGQHILSAAFEQLFDIETASIHIGERYCTIDLEVAQLTAKQVEQAQGLSNQVILENRKVRAYYVEKADLGQFPYLRNQPKTDTNIRLIDIADFDTIGCGGTHPKATGEVGNLAILKQERNRKQVRLTFICGQRVVQELIQASQLNREVGALLHAPEAEIISKTTELLAQKKALEKAQKEWQQQQFMQQAEALLTEQQSLFDRTLILKEDNQQSVAALKKVAQQLINLDSTLLVIFFQQTGTQVTYLLAAGKEAKVNLRSLIQCFNQALNGKGGGSPFLAQGSGTFQENNGNLATTIKELLNQELGEENHE
ncbi:alanyl-tRNA editing protein [Isobaculum melis]|uniref:Alanyl-tRNA synthetase n=1 Tax=Isobaculum melis TaxID=142588 RepID=A0A1H9TWP4_9LACT|nr:DHHA1 domain-containing protein [Isobaculum melis]SES01337.1 alanyl-tRNA synthetase [Isobaculum melis]